MTVEPSLDVGGIRVWKVRAFTVLSCPLSTFLGNVEGILALVVTSPNSNGTSMPKFLVSWCHPDSVSDSGFGLVLEKGVVDRSWLVSSN